MWDEFVETQIERFCLWQNLSICVIIIGWVVGEARDCPRNTCEKEGIFMKKTFAFFAALSFALMAFAGCGGNSGAPAGSGGSGGKVLRVGSSIDFAPFEFQDETQKEYQGFDMDLIRAIAKDMGYEVEIQNIGFDGLIPAIEAKNIDVMISGVTINDERKQKVLFSDPYYESGLSMIVREDNQDIHSFQDLKGKKVAVQIGTTSAVEVHKIEGAEVKEFNTPPDCFMELKAGGVDAVVNDRPVNDYYITKSGATGVKALPDRITAEDYGIAIHKENKELQGKINASLKKLKENGEYQKIYDKWFGGASK